MFLPSPLNNFLYLRSFVVTQHSFGPPALSTQALTYLKGVVSTAHRGRDLPRTVFACVPIKVTLNDAFDAYIVCSIHKFPRLGSFHCFEADVTRAVSECSVCHDRPCTSIGKRAALLVSPART